MQVSLSLIEARNLRKADLVGSSDPYVRVLPSNAKTSFKFNTLNPKWAETLRIPVALPETETLVVEVWDHDYALRDDFLGFAVIDLGGVTVEPKDLWLQLGPSPQAGQLHVVISANVAGPYAGQKARPANAAQLQVPAKDYVLRGSTTVVRTARQDRNATIEVSKLFSV